MEPITFNKEKTDITLTYYEKPVLNISKISFLSSDKQWSNRLFNSILSIKISEIDKENNVVNLLQTPLSLGNYISPYLKQPVLEINQLFRLTIENSHLNHSNSMKWLIEISLSNLKFDNNESLSIEYMDTPYIRKRVEDWQSRVHDLIKTIKIWYSGNNSIKVIASRKQKMHEGQMKTFEVPLMEIESADVQKDGKTILVIKPYGLWIMGANGRLDILTANGSIVLVDKAEKFQSPMWYLYLKSDKNQGVVFSKKSFDQLLGL